MPFQSLNFKSLLYQNRKKCLSGHNSFSYTNKNDLSINCEALGTLSIEISNNKSKKIIFTIAYYPPDVDLNLCKKILRNVFLENLGNNNMIFVVECNINVLDFAPDKTKKSQILLLLCFRLG